MMRGVMFSVVILATGVASAAVAGPGGQNSGGSSGMQTYASSASRIQYTDRVSEPVREAGVTGGRYRDEYMSRCSPTWGEARLRRKGCLDANGALVRPQPQAPDSARGGEGPVGQN
ncbi:MAG: hypothetical protein J7515_13280 [Caulobacter sp.]|nr:hypothetical protein [Caulobacter sp.]